MGVRGLTTYITENSNIYLKPYELCNTYLVIDGNNVASHLYQWSSKSHSAFGGDYDEYYKIVADFFSLLKKCDVTPIVLFDGGYEKQKLKTIISRFETRLHILRGFANGFRSSKFFPLFTKSTFLEVMMDLDIFVVQCDFEADIEIAAIARALNCPVLSYDSDFFIFDVMYIPFSTIRIKPVQYPNSNQYYVTCSIFHVTHLLNHFSGLDKGHLPIIATLLGNDFVNHSSFNTFFNHILMPQRKSLSYNQKKIHGVLHWLKKENVESATSLILCHIGKKHAAEFLQAMKSNTKVYTSNLVSGGVFNKLTSVLGDVSLKKKSFNFNMPNEVMQLYYECKINKLVVDIISLGVYFTFLQVENVHYQSSHMIALPLIKSMYMLLIPYIKKQRPLKLHLIEKNHYGTVKIEKDTNSFLNHVYLEDILKESKQERLKWLCSIVGIDDEVLNIVSSDYWSLFVMSFIYWIKKLKDSITSTHVCALVLMVIANGVVQKSVGYFRTYSEFMKKKGAKLITLKNTKLEVGQSAEFNEMVKSVTLYEKLYIHNLLFPFRQTTEKGSGKAYDISILHLFGSFQSCLFHIMELNALLNYPLPHLKVSDFYSGTLLFNLYLVLKNKPNFGHNLFKETPNLAKIYTYLCVSLCKFLNNFNPEFRKSRKKKKNKNKNKNKSEEESVEVIFCENDEDFDYVDNNNLYGILSCID